MSAEFPVSVRGRHVIFTWSGVIALATAVASFVRVEMMTRAQDQRLSAVEATTKDVATKQDVQELGRRVDRVLELMLAQQRGGTK